MSDEELVNVPCRIGVDHYDKIAEKYVAGINSTYHKHRLEVVTSLLGDVDLQNKLCVDFGCGDGVFCEILAARGATVIGIDPSETMLNAAQERLKDFNSVSLLKGYARDFLESISANIDIVVSLNTLAYLSLDEEDQFYEASRCKLKKDGVLLVTHSNELFDMFTLNKYTVAFFNKYFKNEDSGYDIGDLLVNPEKPGRGFLNIRENPLSYKYKLKKHGFEELKQAYCMFHRTPPLLMPSTNWDDIDAREYPDTLHFPEEHAWKLMFQCSVFASISKKS